MDRFIRSEVTESQRVLAHISGQDISRSPLWYAPEIPTYYGSLLLADSLGIEKEKEHTTSTTHVVAGMAHVRYHSVVWARLGNTVRIGAATSKNIDVAAGLAYRNAVRHLIQGEK